MEAIYPRATEKSYREQTKRTYMFVIPNDMSKQAVAEAVKAQFNVTATDVRILTRKGKSTKYSKGKHAYPGTTFHKDKKIAYVTLKEGDSIKVFEEPEEKEAKKSAKADKKSTAKKGDK